VPRQLSNNVQLIPAAVKGAVAAIGTFETCRPALRTSAYRGRPEVAGRLSNQRD
jgi:hypothetical protein